MGRDLDGVVFAFLFWVFVVVFVLLGVSSLLLLELLRVDLALILESLVDCEEELRLEEHSEDGDRSMVECCKWKGYL